MALENMTGKGEGETVIPSPDSVGQDDTKASVASEADSTASDDGLLGDAAADEAKPETEVADDGLLDDSGQETVNEAPESYEAFDAPGEEAFSDEEATMLNEIAKSQNMTQADAQKGVNFGVELAKQLFAKQEASTKAADDQWKAEQKAEWSKMDDAATKAVVAKAALDSRGLTEHFRSMGFLYDAKLLGLIAEVGKLSGESSALTSTETGHAEKTIAQEMWPNMFTQ